MAAVQGYGTLRIASKGPVTRAVFDNPPINILDHKVFSDLHSFLTSLKDDPNPPKVVVFSSANPKFFFAHYDLHILSATSPVPPPLDPREIARHFVESARMMSKMGVVFIAEIAGQSLGAGNEILLQMDMRFAAPGTKLGSLEVGLGMIHAGGGAQYLTKLIGRGRALEYLLSTNTVDAETAERIGWVNKSFPSVESMQEYVDKLAHRIAAFPAAALAATKDAVNEDAPTEEALDRDICRIVGLAQSVEAQSAVTKFLELGNDQQPGPWEDGLNDNLVQLWQ
jgi:enoyl-CoA hydratase/carnithine racemase